MTTVNQGMQTVRAFGVELEGALRRTQDDSMLICGRRKEIDGQVWVIGSDGSVRYGNDEWGAEIRSPILNHTGPMYKMYSMMMEQGWQDNDSAGLHIHVDFRDLEVKHLKRLVGLMTVVEPIIYAITDESRFDNTYCSRMNRSNDRIQSLKKKMRKRTTEFSDINYGHRDGLNLHAFGEHRSVEFRYFASTSDPTRVEKYIELVTKIVDFIAHARLSQIKPIVQRLYEADFNESCAILNDILNLSFDLASLRCNDTFQRYEKIKWVETEEEKEARLEGYRRKKAEKEARERNAV